MSAGISLLTASRVTKNKILPGDPGSTLLDTDLSVFLILVMMVVMMVAIALFVFAVAVVIALIAIAFLNVEFDLLTAEGA